MSKARCRVTYFITRNRGNTGMLSSKILIWTKKPKRYTGPPDKPYVWWGIAVDGEWSYTHCIGKASLEYGYREFGTVPDHDDQMIRVNRRVPIPKAKGEE